MNRSLVAAGLTAILLAGAAVQTADAQGGQAGAANPPAAKTAEQLRYEEQQRRYQAEQERHRQSVIEAEEARQRYERERAQHESRLDRIRRQQVERGMRVPRRPRDQDSGTPAGEPAAASAPVAATAPAAAASGSPAAASAPANAAPSTAPISTGRTGEAAAAAPSDGSTAPAIDAGSGDATAATAEATQCDRQRERNRRRGRRAGGVFGFVARTFVPFGGVVGAVTAIVPVGELLGQAIAGLLDCDEQQRAATATEEAVRGGVGTTASWTSETRPGVSGSSTVLALEEEPGGAACMTVTDVVIVDGEETQAPKRLCRRPPSSRFVRV